MTLAPPPHPPPATGLRRAAAPTGLILGLGAPTSDNGWLALGGIVLAVIAAALAVAEWRRSHPDEQEPTEEQPDEGSA
ncbi:hypothetical protein [Micromonospora sp. NPDC093277]|uniref:hypothetical protein n=1 Tax=Micromonospora sp. NPDC093277 TaxID=3364291 RepID=UPI0038250308